MGLLVKEDYEVLNEGGWTFVLTSDKIGYVEDDVACHIKNADMLKEMQSGETEVNRELATIGIGAIHMLGWASKPYYHKKINVRTGQNH